MPTIYATFDTKTAIILPDSLLAKASYGTTNAGKVLGIGDNGVVTPVEPSGGSGVNFTSFNPTTAKELFDNAERIKVGSAFAFTNSKDVNANYYYPSDVTTVSNTKFITSVSMEKVTRSIFFRGVVNRVTKSTDGLQYTFNLSGQIETTTSTKSHNVGGENVNIQVLSIVTPKTIVVRKGGNDSYTVTFNGWYINLTQMPATMSYTSWFRDYYATFKFTDIANLNVTIIE